MCPASRRTKSASTSASMVASTSLSATRRVPGVEGKQRLGRTRRTRIERRDRPQRGVEEEERDAHRDLELVPRSWRDREVAERHVTIGDRAVLAAPGTPTREQQPAPTTGAHERAALGVDDVLVLVGNELAAHVATLARPRSSRRLPDPLQDSREGLSRRSPPPRCEPRRRPRSAEADRGGSCCRRGCGRHEAGRTPPRRRRSAARGRRRWPCRGRCRMTGMRCGRRTAATRLCTRSACCPRSRAARPARGRAPAARR